ncbi:MAG: tRNA lysidine(34) synthetase TilS, partial [Thermoleophilia bacterium]|nr:tRNA lysidine(34) synthetase TilS [Thermoleophilia bacterium]
MVTAIREGEFLRVGERTLVMLSGGGDSVALTALAATVCGPSEVTALHVNYGLRGADSDADEQLCRELCERLGVELLVERVTLGEGGNLHDRARDARYRLARAAAEKVGGKAIAVAHNADDRAETLLYRLIASPGRRALLGMPRRRGLIVRPLLDFTREQLRAWCRAEGLAWREDTANVDPRFARTRVRSALAELRSVHPAALGNILHTADELAAEAAALDAVVDGLLAAASGADGLRVGELAAMPAPLAALVLREFTERSVGAPVPAARKALRRVLEAGAAGGSHAIDVEGARLSVEYGNLTARSH